MVIDSKYTIHGSYGKVISWIFWGYSQSEIPWDDVFDLFRGDLSNVQVGEHTIAEKLGEAGYKPGCS